MKITEIKKKIGLDSARFDSISKNKSGNIVFRDSFFYRFGYDKEKFTSKVSTTLTKANIPFEIVDSGEKYVPFRGGDTVAQGSHWYVEVKIKE